MILNTLVIIPELVINGNSFNVTTTVLFLRQKNYLSAALYLSTFLQPIRDVIGTDKEAISFLKRLTHFLSLRNREKSQHHLVEKLKRKFKDHKNWYDVKELFNRSRQHKMLLPYIKKMQDALICFLRESRNYTSSSPEEETLH